MTAYDVTITTHWTVDADTVGEAFAETERRLRTEHRFGIEAFFNIDVRAWGTRRTSNMPIVEQVDRRTNHEWLDEAFGPEVPEGIAKAARRIIQAYGITGECDPMWVANIIAFETGRGNGKGSFAA